MEIGTWLRADIDFGMPYKVFVLNVRSVLGQIYYAALRQAMAKSDVAEIAKAAKEVLVKGRPELKDCEVYGIAMQYFRWSFQVGHPSFPRIMMGSMPEPESIETCPVCGKPLPLDRQFVRETRLRCENVCSEECTRG